MVQFCSTRGAPHGTILFNERCTSWYNSVQQEVHLMVQFGSTRSVDSKLTNCGTHACKLSKSISICEYLHIKYTSLKRT